MTPSRSIAPECRECARPIDEPGRRVSVKFFCSSECRSRWHARQRREAFERYRSELRFQTEPRETK